MKTITKTETAAEATLRIVRDLSEHKIKRGHAPVRRLPETRQEIRHLNNRAMSTNQTTELSEAEVRALRDQVFGHNSTDKNWDGCKEKWLTPEGIQWLQDHV